jgi:hypothetical protein
MAALEFLPRPPIAALVASHLARESRKLPLRRRRFSSEPGDQALLFPELFGKINGTMRVRMMSAMRPSAVAKLNTARDDARPQHLPRRRRPGDALDLDGAEIAIFKEIADQPARARGDDFSMSLVDLSGVAEKTISALTAHNEL